MSRIAARLLIALLVAGVLAGCGRKGAPQPPPGTHNPYPRVYPRE